MYLVSSAKPDTYTWTVVDSSFQFDSLTISCRDSTHVIKIVKVYKDSPCLFACREYRDMGSYDSRYRTILNISPKISRVGFMSLFFKY